MSIAPKSSNDSKMTHKSVPSVMPSRMTNTRPERKVEATLGSEGSLTAGGVKLGEVNRCGRNLSELEPDLSKKSSKLTKRVPTAARSDERADG